MKSLVLTFIADDKPGLVNLLSKTISAHEGNWLESSLSHLGGKFTGILIIEAPDAQIEPMKQALVQLSEQGIRIFAELCNTDQSQPMRSVKLDLIGHDKPGIVREISAALASYQVNVIKLNTELTPGSMSSELLFKASGEIQVPDSVDLETLQDALEAIASDLMVDISLS